MLFDNESKKYLIKEEMLKNVIVFCIYCFL